MKTYKIKNLGLLIQDNIATLLSSNCVFIAQDNDIILQFDTQLQLIDYINQNDIQIND